MAASESARRDRIQAALSAGTTETDRVMFRGQVQALPVVRIALVDTLLNHRSHRIRAQLEGAVAAEVVATAPESDEAQEAIRELLRTTPGFQLLKDNLNAEGQREPGVVTQTGLLINANTRAVALEDLGIQYIDVAVLPPDATIPELYALEADLQVAADYKQDYSFTNELLFVHDLIADQNRSEEQVAFQMRWATPGKAASISQGIERVRSYTRHLALIREIQSLSGGQVALVDFDDTQQTLQEFDGRYEGLRLKDPSGAGEMKVAQILALLANLGYQASREIKPGWVDQHLGDALADNPVLNEVVEAASGDTSGEEVEGLEGLDLLEDLNTQESAPATEAQQAVAALVDRLGRSAQSEHVMLPTAEGEKAFPRQVVLDAVQDAMKAAAESAKDTAAQGGALKAAANYCAVAAKQLNKASDAWMATNLKPDFDAVAFEAELGKAERALAALKQRSNT